MGGRLAARWHAALSAGCRGAASRVPRRLDLGARFNNGITSAGAALTDPPRSAVNASQALQPGISSTCVRRCASSFARPPDAAIRACPTGAFRCRQAATVALPVGCRRTIRCCRRTPADTAWPRAIAGSAGNHDPRHRSAGAALADTHASRRRMMDHQLVAALRQHRTRRSSNASPALFRRSQLQRGGAPPRLSYLAPGFCHAHPGFGPEQRDCAQLAAHAPVGAARIAVRPHRSRHRSVRHRRPARSHAPGLVSGAGFGSDQAAPKLDASVEKSPTLERRGF